MKTSKIESLISEATNLMEHSFIREILKVTKGVEGIISFAGGLPHPDAFPREILSKLFAEIIMEEGHEALQYGASEGDKVFKDIIKDFENVPYLTDDELMITVGSTNGIYYFTRALINTGDIILCEAPSFPGSISSMEACGARLEGIEMDDVGMRPDLLEDKLKKLTENNDPVKFIYVIPEFHNPTGKTMDIERRRDIIKVAMKFGIPILEDQPYRELRFSGERVMTLWEIARTEFNDPKLVTIAKSFSKILGPGLRLGFAAGPPDIIKHMVKWAQKTTVSPDCLTQRVTARFIEKGYMKPHISKIINLYKPKRDAMLESLEKFMPPGITWTKPEGGMFIWVTFDESVDTSSLFEMAIKNKVAFIPGAKFYPSGTAKKNELRLNFSYPDIDKIYTGIERLSQLLK
ncbi:MAG: PLP-dependent aminotransferase family protein [Acidobacteriota bacterium]